jgi:hypothetical protein
MRTDTLATINAPAARLGMIGAVLAAAPSD